jgi:hypothetical protein
LFDPVIVLVSSRRRSAVERELELHVRSATMKTLREML